MLERGRTTEILSSQEHYYSDPVVARVISQHLGWMGGAANLSPRLLDAGPTNLKRIKRDWSPEYLTVMSRNVAEQKAGRVPAKSIKPWQLPDLLRTTRGPTEIFQSLWQKDAPDQKNLPLEERKPIRTLMLLDIEYFHRRLPGKVFSDQEGVFGLLEPIYQELARVFDEYRIQYTTVMTGKGYHFISQVPYASKIMDELIEIGSHIDPDVLAQLTQERPHSSKRDRSVPLKAEQAHKGMGLLSQYLFFRAIRRARETSKIPVEFSDLGVEGASFDLTPVLSRNVWNSSVGTLGSLYVKPRVRPEAYGSEVVRGMSQMVRIVRASGGRELDTWEGLVRARGSFEKVIDNLGQAGGVIPDGSKGIRRLIADYRRSSLRQFHLALDAEPGDAPSKWEGTYRNYAGIARGDERLKYIFENANDKLLDPNDLNYVLHTLFEQWGGNNDLRVAGHVRTWLRSAYEDPRFNWGNRFLRHYSAAQHASGWATIILGQRFGDF